MFKKIMLIAGFVILSFSSFAQDTSFGVTAGYLSSISTLNDTEIDYTDSSSGFYVGALLDITLNESFSLVPAVQYARVSEVNLLYVPLTLQYDIGDSGIYVQGGPQATVLLQESSRIYDKFGLDLGVGLGYDINDNFFVEAKYYHEVTNRHGEDPFDLYDDLDQGLNSLMIGVGYKF
ncbi:porin family protein [Christiangramia marina]|uniref:porin family protein n=1 Tax=Christiangramia marina TaxID=409436 RepID=UPI003AA861D3